MKGEVPQLGGFDAAYTSEKARPFTENERKLARRKAFYETFLGKEAFSSPEELPDSLFLPAQALGDIQQAIQQTHEEGVEYSQYTLWEPHKGFIPSKLYRGRKNRTSRWEAARSGWSDDNPASSSLVALHYHTHPDYPEHAYFRHLITSDTYNFFSTGDIARALYRNTPVHLVATHGGIYGLVQSDMVAKSASQEEVRRKFIPGSHSEPYESMNGYIRGLHDIGFGLYRWQIPYEMPLSRSFVVNWGRFFITKEPQAREMRTSGVTMTKLFPQTSAESSPTPETRVFGQP